MNNPVYFLIPLNQQLNCSNKVTILKICVIKLEEACKWRFSFLISCLLSHDATALVGQGFSLSRFHRHTQSHCSQQNFGRVISPSHRSLPDTTQHSQDTFTSIFSAGFQSAISGSKQQQATPQTVQPLGPCVAFTYTKVLHCQWASYGISAEYGHFDYRLLNDMYFFRITCTVTTFGKQLS